MGKSTNERAKILQALIEFGVNFDAIRASETDVATMLDEDEQKKLKSLKSIQLATQL